METASLFSFATIGISLLLSLVILVLFIPIAVFAVECLTAVTSQVKTPNPTPPSTRSQIKTAVLIPAHNEAAIIQDTLTDLNRNRSGHEQVVVVADNCADDTAEIARSCGVTVLERQDGEKRGKGYALDFGLGYLAADAPEVVIVVDADCMVQPGAIAALAEKAVTSQRPVQACYLMEQPPDASGKTAISALAFLVKNLVRPLGLQQLGWPCLLTGTGMAFPWSAIQSISLASGNIVEDMQSSVDLAIASQAPIFCGEALVIGCLPQQDTAATSQRTRWEHGHMQTLLTQVPRLLQAFAQQRQFDLLALALDLSVPPLSLLILVWLAVAVATAISVGVGISPMMLLGAIALQGIGLFLAVVASWVRFGRDRVSAIALLSVPFYILWKIPLYFAFLIKPQVEWVRTARDNRNKI
ncbi:MAG: glycosyltransferase family 2 protein [Leptolyngbyaceae bacterium]|nr:glycosyltransferase family 2 protein [Leptolyngbyaceae bacterium]